MTNEQTLEIIKGCIGDIEDFRRTEHLNEDQIHDIDRAISTYIELYKEAEAGKLDVDILHENIASYLYVLQ